MKFELPPQLATPQAIAACLHELIQVQENVRTSSLAKRTGATGRPAAALHLGTDAQELLKGVATPGKITLTELGTAIQYLQQVQQDAPVVTITLASEITIDQQRTLAAWFQKLSTQTVLCKFATDASIAGGVIVRTPHRMYDFSFATLLRSQTAALSKELNRG